MKKLYLSVCILGCFSFISPAFGAGLKFEAELSGAQEVADVATDAEGTITARFDEQLTEVEVKLKVKDSAGMFTRAHFHCALPGENGPIAFGLVDPGPLAFDQGRVEGTLTNADFIGANCVPTIGRSVNNIAALAFAMREGLIYINVHSDVFPPGEIRGQLLEN
ncbi:MAG: CHRD domain-containing protein [Gammaproteobacteria bacterium]|nr:CHRD domain-containing protein [Gammaproteobacteria bacterium]